MHLHCFKMSARKINKIKISVPEQLFTTILFHALETKGNSHSPASKLVDKIIKRN